MCRQATWKSFMETRFRHMPFCLILGAKKKSRFKIWPEKTTSRNMDTGKSKAVAKLRLSDESGTCGLIHAV
jgi:hypothetical protein